MKRVLVALAFLGLAFGSSAFAANDGPGCGLGSQVMKGQAGLVPATLAVTLNAIGSATFGMTSGTSGCKADSVVLKDKEQEVFVAANLSTLNQEVAQGQGEHIVALASLMGCPTEVQGEFARMSQDNYDSLFASEQTQATTVLATLKEEMGRRPTLAASCTRIS